MSEVLYSPQYKDQYENSKTIESYGGKATYVDIHPEFSDGRLPVLIASGWSEGRKSLHDTGKVLYDNKKRALLVDHARSGKVPEQDGGFAQEVRHKANTLIEVLNDAGIDKADVLAHSEGALNSVVAALQHPERFNSLVLAMPAGMIGDDSVLKLALRFAPKVARSVTKDTKENFRIGIAVNVGGSAYMAKNPAKAAREVKAMANTTIDEALQMLREKGIKIGVLKSNADSVFPADRIAENTRLDDGPFTNVDSYASVITEDAGHDEILIRPEIATYGAIQMINYLDDIDPA